MFATRVYVEIAKFDFIDTLFCLKLDQPNFLHIACIL